LNKIGHQLINLNQIHLINKITKDINKQNNKESENKPMIILIENSNKEHIIMDKWVMIHFTKQLSQLLS
jgi:hypothetical protein